MDRGTCLATVPGVTKRHTWATNTNTMGSLYDIFILFFLLLIMPLNFGFFFFFPHFLESENSTSLNTSSTGKLVMTSNFANAMPWCMDTMLPMTVISGSAEGPNETGQKSLSRAWCLVLFSLAVALLNYIETYESLNCSLNVLVWLHPSFLPTGWKVMKMKRSEGQGEVKMCDSSIINFWLDTYILSLISSGKILRYFNQGPPSPEQEILLIVL